MKKKSKRSSASSKRPKPQASGPRSSGKSSAPPEDAPRLIDARIRELSDWRGRTLAAIRTLILASAPDIAEQWKWGVPVWTHQGILCTGEVYKSVVKLTFARGAALPDPSGLFNSSLQGNTRRAIDLREGEMPGVRAFKALIRAACALNAQAAAESAASRGVRHHSTRRKGHQKHQHRQQAE